MDLPWNVAPAPIGTLSDTSGLQILDLSNVATASLSEVAYFDTYPVDDAQGYNGAWSDYPFFLRAS